MYLDFFTTVLRDMHYITIDFINFMYVPISK